MKIIIGSDHRGYTLKKLIKQNFKEKEIELLDAGTDNGNDNVDYPIFTKRVCEAVLSGEADRGILICGSGIGVSIAANRFPKIYAALCWTPEIARLAREHDLANVLALAADFTSPEDALKIAESWLKAEFLGGKYQRRLEMLEIS